jgi:predicted nuclease of predicted toxin-antitoxin system
MNLLLDQGIPRRTALLLRQAGIDAVHTGEIGYATAEDYEILARALNKGRVVITLDSDFHMLLAFSGAKLPSVVRVRSIV